MLETSRGAEEQKGGDISQGSSQVIEQEMNFSIIDEDPSFYNQHHDTGEIMQQRSRSVVIFPLSHPLHPKNRTATVKRLKRLAEENREMRMLNKQLDSDLLQAQKQVRILQTKLASELKINRSIREATDAMDRYNDEQAKREATGSDSCQIS